jgi:ADP-heptose:LPS heptosyltransferase
MSVIWRCIKMRKKILVIKFGAMGDVLRTTSILQSLKEKYRKSNIYWVTKKNALPLLKNNSYIKKLFFYNKNTFNLLNKSTFDLIINLDEDFEACSLATKLKKRKIYGFYIDKNVKVTPTPASREWFNMGALGNKPKNNVLKKKNKKTHQQIMHEIIQLPYKQSPVLINLTSKQLRLGEEFKRRHNISNEDVIVGLNTGAGDRWPKQLSINKTAKLAENIYDKYKAKIILFGGPNEIERNNTIISLAKVPVIHTGCGNNLFEFPALINICHLFITSDSLGMHMALGLKRKTIAFFGPTSAAEIEMYDLGKKIIPNSNCYCCYKPTCKAIDSINIKDIEKSIEKLLNPSISLIITAFKEPNIDKAINSALNQTYKGKYEVIVSAPDEKTLKVAKKYKLKTFKDPGKGKAYALKLIFNKFKSDILVLTDGDVSIGKNSIKFLLNHFRDPGVGVVTGRPMAMNPKNDKYGFFSHLLLDAGAHKVRSELNKKNKFIECTGYLFAIRNIIKNFPLDVAEDSVIPYLIWKKGYKIKYEPNANVYVKYPSKIGDFIKQRKRAGVGSHSKLDKYFPDFPRVKTFKNEVFKGPFWALKYPSNLKEFIWTLNLFPIRFYIWFSYYFDAIIRRKTYGDGWERIESTK